MRKEKPLKIKELQFVDKLLENDGMLSKTARDVFGTSGKYSHIKAVRLLARPEIIKAVEKKKQSLIEALEIQGVNSKKIAQKIDELLNSEDSQSIDKGLTHAIKVRGDYREPEQPTQSKSSATYNFIFSGETQERIKAIDKSIKDLLIKPKKDAEEN